MRARIKIDFKDIPYRQKQKIIELLEKKNDISLRDLPQSVNLFRLSPNHYQELILTK